ncbi:MAG TPA: hypothetical protein QGI39_11210, partial [Gammaproteobacteria bacterium]|nr:hypothetical protein [Gammaproteobacteria bacterium]
KRQAPSSLRPILIPNFPFHSPTMWFAYSIKDAIQSVLDARIDKYFPQTRLTSTLCLKIG